MPSEGSELLQCYNRGCGQKFDPQTNKEDSCIHHPGAPFFHDAYKGWSCCNKKCTDFTEFLNIKGCTKSYHSNVKPPEPEKPVVDKSKADEVIEYKAPEPLVREALERPSFDSPLMTLKVDVSPALAQQVQSLKLGSNSQETPVSSEIPIGTPCKNGGCKQVYEGSSSNHSPCIYHPGVPVFHEGLKFWSCCQRRTTDFNSFLEQEGCKTGTHVWIKEKQDGDKSVACRFDWHQTATHVVVSVFAKKYDPNVSSVELNPIRLKVHLFFPEEDSSFDLDVELRGIVDVDRSSANMLQTKLEVKLRKAEPGSWPKLDFPRIASATPQKEEKVEKVEADIEDDSVDLSDL
ncbi:Cysteine and histidine-rich domain-containing protein [Gryllus bimaculatus]|nr:Cysteine and histidine-rich domain-containing protein [Gryllus bimaculatus]